VLAADERAEVGSAPAGREDNEWPFRLFGELLCNCETGHVGQQHVQQDDVGTKCAGGADGGCSVLGIADDDVARGLEELSSKPTKARVVIHDERRSRHDVIVPHVDAFDLLDFPELAPRQGNT
jgi:hypothetical protein